MSRERFIIPGECTVDTPFDELHFWSWASTVPRSEVTLRGYLGSLGFDIETQMVDPVDYEILDYACRHWHHITARIPGCHRFEDFFTRTPEVEEGERTGYFVVWSEGNRSGYYDITKPLKEELSNAGWVYDVTPETTYFEVIGDTVWARYQQIIGSRPLLRLK